jgi:outer membrane protein assembly factor BamB
MHDSTSDLESPAPHAIVALNGKVYAIDASTGELRWQNELKGSGYGAPALAITKSRVFVSAHGSAIHCLDYSTGQPIWTENATSSGRASILIHDGRVYVAKGGSLDCYTLDGRKVFSQPLRGAGVGPVALGFPGKVVQADERGE